VNSQFNYLYRDAWNYKKFHSINLAGVVSLEQIEPFLRDYTFFVPSEVGLPDLQEEVFKSYDHIWHEIETLELTDEQPTVTIDASTLLANFKKAHNRDWNEGEVFVRKGLV
jgi:hypothetical protein